MNGFIRWALDLKSLAFGQEGVEFGFARPIPAWGWTLIAIAIVGAAWWSYRRLEGSRVWRALLCGARVAILLLLVLLISGPRLIKPNEIEEKDWVIVMADRSASMGIKDAPASSDPSPEGADGRARTREDQLKEAIALGAPVWRQLEKDRVLVWLGFDSGVFELPSGAPGSGEVNLQAASGRRTAIGRALDQALRRASARPVSGVVLLTDGRSIDEPARAAMRRLQAERIPVFTVALGSRQPVTDYSIRRAEGPKSAFVNDFVPIEVEVERLGGGAATTPGARATKLQLIDDATGLVLDEKEVTWDSPASRAQPEGGDQSVPPAGKPASETASRPARVTLTTRSAQAGTPKWSVRIVPGTPDLVEENNASGVAIEMIDRPLRVAYFDGYPRWEQRYIKNLLVRERSMRGSSMLLASGRRYVQEGDDVMMTLPRSPEEWRQYDTIIIGDVRPELFTSEQLEQIKEHVAVNGAGLIWIGGEGATPGAWRGTPLADLLPFVLSGGEGTGMPVWPGPVTVSPTPLADRLGVLRLLPEPDNGTWWPPEISDPATGWSQLRWAQRIEKELLKPTTEVLATARSAEEPAGSTTGAGESVPLLVSMRFGAGRVLYLGTDEIWRWRYGRGELYAERFYLQMMRMLGRESLSRAGKAATLEVSPQRAEIEQPVRISVDLIDQSLVDAAPASIRMRIVREGAVDGSRDPGAGADASAPVELVLSPESGGGVAPGRTGRTVRTYAATWISAESGRYRIESADSLLAGIGASGANGSGVLSANVEIWLPDDELRRPETDHELLAKLSEATEGAVMTARDLKDLPALLPNRKLRLPGEPDVETLWDTPLALMLIVVLLTIEWVGRRLIRLA